MMVLGGVVAAADESAGGDFTVTPSAGLLVWTFVLLVGVVIGLIFLVRGASRRRNASRRFVSVAHTLATFGIALVGLGVLAGVIAIASTSGNVSFGDRIEVYGDRVEVLVPSGTSFAASREETAFARSDYGRGARVEPGSVEVRMPVNDPSVGDYVVALLPTAALLGGFLLLLIPLRALLGSVLRGRVFVDENVTRLRLMAVSTIVIGPIADLVTNLATGLLIDAAGARGGMHSSVSFSALWFGILLLALAEVWRYGIQLQRDAEVTV